jgi:hypothetical protein
MVHLAVAVRWPCDNAHTLNWCAAGCEKCPADSCSWVQGVIDYAAVYMPTEPALSVYLTSVLRGRTDDDIAQIITMLATAHLANPDESGDPSPTLIALLGKQTVQTALSDNGATYSCPQTITLTRTTSMGVSIKSSNGTTAVVASTYRLCASASKTSVVFINGVLVPCDLFGGAADTAATTDTSTTTTTDTTTAGFGTGFSGLSFNSTGTTFGGSSSGSIVAGPAMLTLALIAIICALIQL